MWNLSRVFGISLVYIVAVSADENSTEIVDKIDNSTTDKSIIIDSDTIQPGEVDLISSSTKKSVEVPGIFGCRWPDDFMGRYRYCIDKSELIDFVHDTPNTEIDVRNGLLDPGIMNHLRSECTTENMEECLGKIDKKAVDSFINRWKISAEKFQKFEKCLQKNTEAMNRMCGTDSELSKVVSGAAGLQLNILIVLVRIVESAQENANMTEDCWTRIAEAAHLTTALYVKDDRFMENAVLCWNVVHTECNDECSVYAKELACMQAACPGLRPSTFQEFGIWQWFFLNSDLVRKQCQIEDKECAAGTLVPAIPKEEAASSSLFNMKTIRAKFHNVQVQLENTFQLPFYILSGIALSVFVAFAASITVICMWKHGLLRSKGKRNSRYSRLTTDGKDESRSLTAHAVDEIE